MNPSCLVAESNNLVFSAPFLQSSLLIIQPCTRDKQTQEHKNLYLIFIASDNKVTIVSSTPPSVYHCYDLGTTLKKICEVFKKQITTVSDFWFLETIKGGFLSFQKHFWFVLQKFSDCRCDKVAKVQPMKTFFLKFVWKGSAPTHNKKQNKWILFSCFVDKIFSCGIT